MANRHVKVINGRKYYYESIRRGRKVTSRYIGPVDERKRKSKKSAAEEEQIVETQQPAEGGENYIG